MSIDALYTVPEWPRFLGLPRVRGNLRVKIEDFIVDELPQLQPSGEGSHLWLQVQKRGANTDWVAGQLARAASCAARDVGYAGMKDRHAITTQWFSIPASITEEIRWDEWDIPDVRIIQAVRHQRKLKRGALKGNRFTIKLRALQGDLDDLAPRLALIHSRGIPNYFGPQRFGHDGSNVQRGVRWLLQGGRLPRAKRSIYLSAVRSYLFNQVLAGRLEQGTWDQLLDGEVVMLDGTHSVFHCEIPDQDLVQRCRDFDIHPTGPLPGDAVFEPMRQALTLEEGVLNPYFDVIEALRKARVDSGRRSLRLRVAELEWELSGDQLLLKFTLPPGAYATTVISELVSTSA